MTSRALLSTALALLVTPTASIASAQQPRSESVTLATATGTLHGTLELPAGAPPYPVALIIAGSGPTDRNGNTPALPGANNSLQFLAEGLAARGIASLRYDKRGAGASGRAMMQESDLRFDTFVEDAAAWLRQLRADERFSALAVIGHSEGSLLGMLAAQRAGSAGGTGGADVVVSIAGPGRPADRILHDQLSTRLPPELRATADSILAELTAGRTVDSVPAKLFLLFRPSVQPYLVSWFRYDPAAEAARLTMPLLVVQGTTDVQVDTAEARRLVAAQPRARLLMVEGMNHVLKSVPADPEAQRRSYSDPSLPLPTVLVDGIAEFLKQ